MTTDRKAGHTAGPWVAVRRRGNWDYLVAQQADGMNNEICQMFHDGTDLNETGEANALLVATSPDLLAVAEMVDQWGNGLRHPTAHETKMVSAARAAIASVGGEKK